MTAKIFIDGEAGTTGLLIRDLLAGRADLEIVSIAPDKRNMALVETSTKKVIDAMEIADAHLASHAYVTGEKFTIGDIPLGCALARWLKIGRAHV